MIEDEDVEESKTQIAKATGLSILSAVPMFYALETGEDIALVLLGLPVGIGILCFPGVSRRIVGIAYAYMIAVPTVLLLGLMFHGAFD